VKEEGATLLVNTSLGVVEMSDNDAARLLVSMAGKHREVGVELHWDGAAILLVVRSLDNGHQVEAPPLLVFVVRNDQDFVQVFDVVLPQAGLVVNQREFADLDGLLSFGERKGMSDNDMRRIGRWSDVAQNLLNDMYSVYRWVPNASPSPWGTIVAVGERERRFVVATMRSRERGHCWG
jgi:hypothetical protein